MNKKYQYTWLVVLPDAQRLSIEADWVNIEGNGTIVFYEKIMTDTTWHDESLLQAFPTGMWLSVTRLPKEETVDASDSSEHNT